ncbi:hypothetical protein FOMPIDRAFT_1029033 [Fomitopsis schrenkii]|uniref:Uncharacterized protein n=1 Tax=Fomitopsis schrenkii TaxID=2126942 RepID=S8FP74_FOMSC|nr:hypothetical protein FOMPIDRAFT_1029033 [Fomitopsis schrenkii]
MLHTLSDALPVSREDHICMSKSLPLYLQQPSLEIIQLIEVPPPPPQQRTFPASSFMSSSYASSSSSDQSDHESACSSYCSSDPEEDASRLSVPDDTYKTRLHRVLLWREKLMKALGTSSSVFIFLAAPPPPPSTHLKRKADDDEPELDDDTASHSSKRSRSSSYRSHAPWSQSTESVHSCPACDASFTTRQSLQQHAAEPSPNDACRAAVEYDFEA